MAKDVVLKIKKAEDASAETIKNAYEKAKSIISGAETEGGERYKAMIKEAHALRDELIRKAEESAGAACVPMEEANAKEIAKILNPEQGKFQKAVEAVMGRIVN